MKSVKIISVLGLVAMTGVVLYGFTMGDFFGEGAKLMAMPWGVVSLGDLYTGFALFSGWIFYREKSLPAILWALAMLTLGFWAGSLYALLAAIRSGNDGKQFWLGKHA